MFDIFEHPWCLLIISVVAAFAVWVVGCLRTAKKLRLLWLVPILLAVAAFGVDRLVTTDREKITAVIKTATQAVEDEDAAAIEAVVSEDYRDSFHHNKKQMMRAMQARLSRPLVRKNITRIASLDVSGPRATAVFTIRILFDPQSYVYQTLKSQMLIKVQLDLKRIQDTWLISQAELVAIDLQPAKWKDISGY